MRLRKSILALRSIVAIAAMTVVPAVLAQDALDKPASLVPKAVGGPEFLLYTVSGVRASGVDNSGAATSFICTNISSANETIRVRLFNEAGVQVTNIAFTVVSVGTITFSTNATNLFGELIMGASAMNPAGAAGIFATHTDVYCTAMLVDAALLVPQGIALHMVRWNPIYTTQE